MRDVKRVKMLMQWFRDNLRFHRYSSREDEKAAVILGLAHCYHSRLADSSVRMKYRGIHIFSPVYSL